MQNEHALSWNLKIIEFKYIDNELRYWREILAVFYFTLEESFPELTVHYKIYIYKKVERWASS
jgi:hypothetical protein